MRTDMYVIRRQNGDYLDQPSSLMYGRPHWEGPLTRKSLVAGSLIMTATQRDHVIEKLGMKPSPDWDVFRVELVQLSPEVWLRKPEGSENGDIKK